MTIKELAKIIYRKGFESANRHITVRTYIGDHKLWSGLARDLQKQDFLKDYTVVEMLIDYYDELSDDLPDYNRGKVITVV